MQERCRKYWPDLGEEDLVANDISVTLMEEKLTLNYAIRELQIKKVRTLLLVSPMSLLLAHALNSLFSLFSHAI